MNNKKRPDDHEFLLEHVIYLDEDYVPYGKAMRIKVDCSSNCKWYLPLQGHLSFDWGVCANPKSHRCGLLTFEHQGCNKFQEKKEIPERVEHSPFWIDLTYRDHKINNKFKMRIFQRAEDCHYQPVIRLFISKNTHSNDYLITLSFDPQEIHHRERWPPMPTAEMKILDPYVEFIKFHRKSLMKAWEDKRITKKDLLKLIHDDLD
jgi:hypothetical protein